MFNAGVHKNPAISMMDLNKLNIWGHVIKIQCILIEFLINNNNKMDIEDILKSVDHIALFIAILIFLIIKFLKYLLGRERLKIKRSSSLYNSINSTSPNSI